MEVFRDVVGFEGLYQVSSHGRVYSVPRHTSDGRPIGGKFKATKKNNRGYVQIHLYKDNKDHMKLIHRLVAEAFLPNPEACEQVNHKDENKDNNRADNLEWCDNLYNRRYGTGYKRSVEKHDYKKMAASRMRPVVQVNDSGAELAVYSCARIAAEAFGKSGSAIRMSCVRGHRSCGFYWKYAS